MNITINRENEYRVLFFSSVVVGKSDPRFPLAASRLYVAVDKIEATLKTYGAVLEDGEYESFLCNNTYPDASYDMIKGRSFPLEYGLDNYNAISFSKGCYVGQELIARTKYRGTIRKKLFRIESNHNIIEEKGSEVMVDGKPVGIFCSAYKKIGKVLLREDIILPESDPGIKAIYANTSNSKFQIIIPSSFD